MKQIISVRLASNIILAISTIALLMHALILLRILPHTFIWGGRLQNETDVNIFESLSILIQILFIVLIATKAGYMFKRRFQRTVNISIWIIFILMVLNTIGNLASFSSLETIIMTPVTGVLALLTLRLAIEK